MCNGYFVSPLTIASGTVKSRDILAHISIQIIQVCHNAPGCLCSDPNKSSFSWNLLCERNITEPGRKVSDERFVMLCFNSKDKSSAVS